MAEEIQELVDFLKAIDRNEWMAKPESCFQKSGWKNMAVAS
jgi:hypothetical protein